MPRLIRLLMFLLMAGFLFAAGCAQAPYTNRSQLMMMSPSEEMALGNQAATEVLKKEKETTDTRYTVPLKRVGQRIAVAAEQSSYNWEFHVIASDDINAFCLPGGKIFFYTGMFKVATTDAMLATVMGHEAAHAIARHGAERMSMTMITQLGQQVAVTAADMGGGSGMGQAVGTAFGLGANFGVLLPYSRTQETEADRIGLILMAKAGYDPNVAVSFWENMSKMGGQSPPEFMSTHPTDTTRINNIRQFLPEAMEYYNQSKSAASK